jgi:DNA repair photolyase
VLDGFLPFRWTVDPYRGCMHACSCCFAGVTRTHLDMGAGRDLETKIVVKVDAAEVRLRPRPHPG